MVNVAGRVQRIKAAVTTLYDERSLDGFSMSRWDKFGAHNDRWTRGRKFDVKESWRILTGLGNALGLKWKYASGRDVFDEITGKIPAFKGLTYHSIERFGAPVKAPASKPVPAGV